MMAPECPLQQARGCGFVVLNCFDLVCQSHVPWPVAWVWYLLNFLYLFFLGSIAAAAGPLVIATWAVVEVLSFWVGVAGIAMVGEWTLGG